MASLPVMLEMRGKRCVVVGGGKVAARRAEALLNSGAEVVVIAPAIDPRLAELAANPKQAEAQLSLVERAFEAEDVTGACLVVVATDSAEVNLAAAEAARDAGALVNRADDAGEGDITWMAFERVGPITLAADSGGVSPWASKETLSRGVMAIGEDWPAFLADVKPLRLALRHQVSEAARRGEVMREVLGDESRQRWQRDGVERWRRWISERFAVRL